MNQLTKLAFRRSYSGLAAVSIPKKMPHQSCHERIVVNVEKTTGIATMYLNKPPANNMDCDLLKEATNAIEDVAKDVGIKGIMLTSMLDWGVFTHGINVMDIYKRSDQCMSELWDRFHDWFVAWYGCTKPVIAVINGNASSAGCVWALMCDYRIMLIDQKTKIGFADKEMGIAPAPLVVDLLRSVVGNRNANVMALGGGLLSAQEALRIGLVNEVTCKDFLLPRARQRLQHLMEIPTEAYSSTKLRWRETLLENIAAKKHSDPDYYQQHISHLPP